MRLDKYQDQDVEEKNNVREKYRSVETLSN